MDDDHDGGDAEEDDDDDENSGGGSGGPVRFLLGEVTADDEVPDWDSGVDLRADVTSFDDHVHVRDC